MKKIKLAIPKGSLLESTLRTFEGAGFRINFPSTRSCFPLIDDPEIECILLRPQEIPRYIEEGIDVGISGSDWIEETGAHVVEIADLEYAKRSMKKIKWVLAVPYNSKIQSVKDLEGKTISTEIIQTVKNYLKKHNTNARVEFSWGATEAKPPYLIDAIVDVTETGISLTANKLKIIDTVIKSSTRLIANKKSMKDAWKREKIENIGELLKGVIEGTQSVLLMMHVPTTKLDRVLKELPAHKVPTAQKLAGEGWYDIIIGVRKKDVRSIIPLAKSLGCSDIIELPMISYNG